MAAFSLQTLQVISFLANAATAEAEPHAGEEHAHEGVSPTALPIFRIPGTPDWFPAITNSVIVAVIVTALITWFVRSAMKGAALLPGKKQNFLEMLVEFLYGQVENIVGPKVAPKAFPLLGTIFIFSLVSNYFGLLPGVGTVGMSSASQVQGFTTTHVERPFLRPPTSDMNFTVGMALVAMLIWLIITLRETGLIGFLKHTFGAKGGLKGIMGIVIAVIFFVVGLIEIVSIVFRPVSLSLRMYGNIFAGESLLHAMGSLLGQLSGNSTLGAIGKFLLPLPFYFLELLVGVLQPMVFTLLVAVYIQLTTTHDEHDHAEGEHAHH